MKANSLFVLSAVTASMLIAACSSTPITEDDHGSMFLVEVPAIGMMFPYWETLTPVQNVIYDEELNPERTGEYGGDLKGETITAFLSVINYERPSDGLGDWSITRSVQNALSKNINESSCELLKHTDIYLPVDMNSPHTCEASVTLNGQIPFIIAQGLSHGSKTPSDMMVILHGDHAIILSQLIQAAEPDMGLLMSIGRGIIFE